MKAVTKGHVKAALASVRSTRWRSFWTMLGIIIAVVSVVSIVGIGEGIKQQVKGQIDHLGKDLITVQPSMATGASPASLLGGFAPSSALDSRDVSAVASATGKDNSAPLGTVAGTASGDSGASSDLVIATTPALPQLLNQSMAFGVFFSDSDIDQVAVLGSSVAKRLFNSNVPLGYTLHFRGQDFIIRGIFNDFPYSPLSGQVNLNDAIFIPYHYAQQLTNNSTPIYQILAKPVAGASVQQAVMKISSNLQRVHGGNEGFSVLTQKQSLAASSTILDLITRLIDGMAIIALLVGGIGIMNIMLVSVTERMHEIGVRKTVGATNRQILSQFVIEASVLSMIGGLVGVVLSLLIDLGLRIFTSFKPVIDWRVMFLACAVSIAVGVVFGSVPALKAARRHPIDALRNI